MSELFSPDNLIWRIMGRVADVFLLTMIWALCSLPIITIGASTTALYHVTLKIAEKKDGYLIRTFWKAWKENLLSSTIIWLITGSIGVLLSLGLRSALTDATVFGKTFVWFFLVTGILYLFFVTVLFPLSARLSTSIMNLFLMTFMVCIKKFSWVLFMVVILGCILAVGIFVFWPVLLFSAGAIALSHSFILVTMIFPEYNWNLKE